jgi:predicted RND superfamily exporter protein
MTTDARVAERIVAWVQRHAMAVLGVTVAVCAGAALLASRLALRTSFAELLPDDDPGVVELHRIEKRLGGRESLVIGIESPSRASNVRYARAITAELSELPADVVQVARYEAKAELDFFKQRRWLYADIHDLEDVRNRLAYDLVRHKNPFFVALEEPPSWQTIKDRVKQREGELSLPEDGVFATADGTFVAVVAVPPGGLFGNAADRLYAAAGHIITRLPHPPGMKVGLSGDVATQIQERDALAHDLVGATLLTVVLIASAVTFFYGRARAVPLMAIPALCGVTIAFGLAEVAFGYLNSSTAFLGSIILGNGVNYAIILLARYEEERRAGQPADRAGQRATAGTLRATAVAAGAASIAYGSLMMTRFRGFSQFGVIGGAGMVLAWLATVLVLPALLYRLDRNRPPRAGLALPPGMRLAAPLGRLATRRPGMLLLAGAVLTACALALLPGYLRDPFEYDFHNLRSARASGRGYHNRINDIFGETLSPSVVLLDRAADAPAVTRAIREKDRELPGHPIIAHVVSLDNLLPGPVSEQKRKLAVLADIRHRMHDPAIQLLDDDEQRRLREWEPPAGLLPVTLADLPNLVLKPFTERDGTLGRVVLVYPVRQGFSSWNGRDLMRMASILGVIELPDGQQVRSSGHAVVFAAMIRSILHDAPIATLASFLGVAALTLALSPRRRGAIVVLSALVLGVLWMVGTAAAVRERVNFLNFIALPITFGIGVDYGINIYLRYLSEGRGRVCEVVRATGGAVALCSSTTIIGYGALLVAKNRALRSFGGMAMLGEFATLAAALLILPAYLTWRERIWARARPADRPAPSARPWPHRPKPAA